jgi:hypothetical protein
MTASYATIANLREYLPQIASGATNDAMLGRILERARGAVDNVLRFSFFDVDVTTGTATSWPSAAARTVPTMPTERWIRLPSYKLGSVATITYTNDTNTTTTLSDWSEDWNGGEFCLFHLDGWKYSPYIVTAQWGFGPPIPIVTEICLELAVNIWRTREKGSFVEAQGQGGTTIKAVGAISPQQKEALQQINRLYMDWIDYERP